MTNYTLEIKDEYVEEGHIAHAKLQLDKPAPYDIKVYYRTEDGSAKDFEDYYGTHEGYLVIPAYKGWETIDIQTVDDYYKEGKEDFKIKIWTNSPFEKVGAPQALGPTTACAALPLVPRDPFQTGSEKAWAGARHGIVDGGREHFFEEQR